jgi:transposase
MRRAADVALVAKWRERISRWRRSGLSITDFCQREEISQPSFFAWRKRLAGQRAVTSRRRSQRGDRDAPTPRLVQLPAPGWATTAGVQIALPSGAVVTLPQHASTELVATAIRVAMVVPVSEDRPC